MNSLSAAKRSAVISHSTMPEATDRRNNRSAQSLQRLPSFATHPGTRITQHRFQRRTRLRCFELPQRLHRVPIHVLVVEEFHKHARSAWILRLAESQHHHLTRLSIA